MLRVSGTTDLAHVRLLTRVSDKRTTWVPDYGDTIKESISCQAVLVTWGGKRWRETGL